MGSGSEQILLVTSDEIFARTMEKQLGENGYDVTIVATVAGGVATARQTMPAMILVDLRQRHIDHFRREHNLSKVPVLALHPPGLSCSKEQCLQDLEGDVDMVLCNQGYREVIARIRAVLRREHLAAMPKPSYDVGSLRVDVDRHEVTVDGHLVDLTPKEFRILQQLVSHPSRVFSRDELLNRVWGEDCALEEHTLDVHIHSLRQKIEPDPASPRFIVTVRGIGYKLKADS
jgi:DNA-binding response OmpR family regulator